MALPYAKTKKTHVDFLEDVIADLSAWAVDYIDTVINAIAPDGRVFGMEKLSEKEELMLYRNQLRGNKEAWDAWRDERVNNVKELIAKSGLGEDVIRAVHPFDLVERYALKFSYRMERLMQEYDNKALEQSPRPAVGEIDDSADTDSGTLS